MRPHVGHAAERPVGDAKRELVAGGFEHWQRLEDERLQGIGGACRLDGDAQNGLVNPAAQLADAVV